MNRNWVVTLAYELEPDMQTMDRWEDDLNELGADAMVSRVPGRGIDIAVHADDTTLDEALIRARTKAASVIDADPVGVEVITADEQLRRAALTGPELMSAAEIAKELGVSRQRVHQLRGGAAFPDPLADLKGGAVWDARAVRQFALEWSRRAGRPPGTGYAISFEKLLNGAWTSHTEQRPTESEAVEFYRALLSNPDIRDARLQGTSSD
ncbi:MAG: hypothetical protein O3B27_06920 [Actinomycetota bacterium]|nr:hypothetical protein [Actinomycetota bacterium]MDA2950854.1 hypothetical protein [Actinomycetota bacterium]MDA2991270.1 hypothetical protein [Actinomycetota bacterium]